MTMKRVRTLDLPRTQSLRGKLRLNRRGCRPRKAVACACFAAGFLLADLRLASALEIPEARYPSLPKCVDSAEGFVPQEWKIEIQDEGDLNEDGLRDLLLVLRGDDPANVVANDPESPGEPSIDTNPRILATAFAQKGGGYSLVLENHVFIPRYESPTLDDPFGFAESTNGDLRIGLHYWANAGSWYTSDTTFTFRYLDEAFRLVGYADYLTKRNTGETWDLKIDYLARMAEITLGRFSEDDVEDRTYYRSLPSSPLLTIDEVGEGWAFAPEQGDLSWWDLNKDSE
jgi:hypothetical protein